MCVRTFKYSIAFFVSSLVLIFFCSVACDDCVPKMMIKRKNIFLFIATSNVRMVLCYPSMALVKKAIFPIKGMVCYARI